MIRMLVSRRVGTRTTAPARLRQIVRMMPVVLTTALVVVAQLFVSGMIEGIVRKYTLVSDGTYTIRSNGSEPVDVPSLVRSVRSDIREIVPVINGAALAYAGDEAVPLRLKGVDTETYFSGERAEAINFHGIRTTVSGAALPLLLSKDTAAELGVGTGDRLTLMLIPDGTRTAARPVLAAVVAVFSTGYSELDKRIAFVEAKDARKYFSSPSAVVWEIVTDSPVSSHIQNLIQNELPASYEVVSLKETQPTIFENLLVSQRTLTLVFVLIAILAGYFVSTIGQEFIQDDRSAIATLKLMGFPRREISWTYLVMIIGMTSVGLVTGIFIGWIIALATKPLLLNLSTAGIPALSQYLLDFTISISVVDALMVFIVFLAVSVLSALLSIRRVQDIMPLD
ncbi:ABC transporter permease [Parasphaerochaeta coccoides]|uniref:ABC3 transporter permease C-terminal domain-containing protein n=1 Tax=Parasphaerochaeta coccoides (strain ATCC BAA-1237 / DSM 17374 / SPN1) TaxID=760011 RepID=F4GJD0_PARC1|nr:FtsX-like permease family protein [Parasphaerochaeta coccoides]AEC01770.1 protein of unknown function DUF214 [Parasphaerochaeta coccoides DSM 17374]